LLAQPAFFTIRYPLSAIRFRMPNAIRIHAHGGPEVLRWEPVVAAQPGRGEVLIRQTAIGLNFIDVYERTGLYAGALPSGLGREGAGVVEAVGPRASGLAVGDRVAYLPQASAEEVGSIMELHERTNYVVRRSVNLSHHKHVLAANLDQALLMVTVPVAEAVLSFEDKDDERLALLKEILNRHEARLYANFTDKSYKPVQTNCYVSGKKFVLESLMRTYKGVIVNNDFNAIVTLNAGGFFSPKTIDVTLKPKRDTTEQGTLDWYRTVVEKDPFGYMLKNKVADIMSLGKVENLAGEQKLRIKNAKAELWIVPNGGDRRSAVYYNKVDFGDIYLPIR